MERKVFEDIINRFEPILKEILLKIGFVKNISQNQLVVRYHFFMNKILTQKQLQGLTGFASSTISSILSQMENSGQIKKVPKTSMIIKHKGTKEIEYFLDYDFYSQTIQYYRYLILKIQDLKSYIMKNEDTIKEIRISLLSDKINLANNAESKSNLNKEIERLLDFLKNGFQAAEMYEKSANLIILESSKHVKQNKIETNDFDLKKFSNMDTIKEYFNSVEQTIGNKFNEIHVLPGRDEIIMRILTQFLFKLEWTQTELQKSTHFSSGVISKKLIELEKQGFLKRKFKENTREVIYFLSDQKKMLTNQTSTIVEVFKRYNELWEELKSVVALFKPEDLDNPRIAGLKAAYEYGEFILKIAEDIEGFSKG